MSTTIAILIIILATQKKVRRRRRRENRRRKRGKLHCMPTTYVKFDFSLAILTTIPHSHLHLTHEESEVQRLLITCPGPTGQKQHEVAETGHNSRLSRLHRQDAFCSSKLPPVQLRDSFLDSRNLHAKLKHLKS